MKIKEAILDMFGSIKTMLVKEFDRRYAIVMLAAAAATTSTVTTVGLHRSGRCSTENLVNEASRVHME